MFIQYGVDDDGDDGGKVGFSHDFDENDYEAACLEDRAMKVDISSDTLSGMELINSPSVGHNIPVAFLYGVLDVHREMTQAVDLESLTNTT